MSNFRTYCEKKFPRNWEIIDIGNGIFHFRDNLISKGNGFIVAVEEEFSKYEVRLIFESFAKDLSNHALENISETNSPLSKLIELNSNLSVIVYKHFIEKNLDPETFKFENWDFNLRYRKEGSHNDADRFSDILISFILYIFPYEFDSEEEGSSNSHLLTKYERSHINRSLCLAYHGYNCKACSINLKDIYGDIARDFIHVHHLNPISISGIVKPDPINDFVPLCPNCHSIAHLKNPPLTIQQIQNMLKENGNTNTK